MILYYMIWLIYVIAQDYMKKKSVPNLTTVYILLHQHIDYIGKGDGPPTHDAYRSWLAMETDAMELWAQRGGGLELCSYWVSRALATFTQYESQNTWTQLYNVTWSDNLSISELPWC